MMVAISRSALLEVEATAAGRARSHARGACAGVTSQDLAADVVLVVSELVTNALRHGRGKVRLDLRADPGEVFVSVWDAGRTFDWIQEPAHHVATTGRGLGIVTALATGYGVRAGTGADTGKSVWCIVQESAPG